MTSQQDWTVIGIVASRVSVYKTPDKSAKKVGNGNWNAAIPVQASCRDQFWHRLGEFK